MHTTSPNDPTHPDPPLNLAAIRIQFPILDTLAHGRPLVYLDSAASTQQPTPVIEAVSDYHRQHHANIHRGSYLLSQTATRLYEQARARVARFIHAADPAECIFVRGATEGINLVAAAWGRANLQPGDEIILSTLEHHSNIVPWQLAAQATGARIRVIPIDDRGVLRLDEYRRLLSPRTRIVAVNQVSNALGTINPVREIIADAHAAGALVLIDGAQWVAHGVTDVQALDADFYVFSGHKVYAPTGIGVLYGKRHLLEAMPPWQGGGDMIEQVRFEHTDYAGLPNRFEAGTPHIAGAVGLAAALEWVDALGLAAIGAHEQALLRLATERLAALPGVVIQGRAPDKSGVLSWVVTDPPLSALDLGMRLDLEGICVRTGHHCCQPLMERLGVSATARASFGVYNTEDDVERLAAALARIIGQARRAGATAAPAPDIDIDIAWPPARAASPEAAAADIAELFELLPDWPMRHQQIIDLGEALPDLPARLRTPEHFVAGCQSSVYIAARLRPGSGDIIEFLADSDAMIVRGLIALLQQLYGGQHAAAILAFDADAFFARIGLDRNLSLTRRNGLAAMVGRIRELAARHAG